MKQILRIGERYGLSAIKRHIGYVLLIVIGVAWLQNNKAQAQSTNIKALGIPEGGLKIGDSIPESLWHLPLQVVNHPEGKDTITLNDYRGKLIILDFWATWCHPCVASLDKMDKLKDTLHLPQVVFLPVLVNQDPKQAKVFMNKRGWSLPSLANDTILRKQLLKRYLGGYGSAWILEGKLLAVPFSTGYINKNMISKVLHHQPVDFIMDVGSSVIDATKPLFTKGNGNASAYYRKRPYSVIARYSPELFYEETDVNYLIKDDTTILYGWNLTLQNLYYEAFKNKIFPGFGKDSGIRWEISDATKSRFLNKPLINNKRCLADDLAWRSWLEANTFGYNLRFPEKVRESEARYFMQQDLNTFFGIYLDLNAQIEFRDKRKYPLLRLAGTREESEKLLTVGAANLEVSARKKHGFRDHVTYDQHFLADLNQLVHEIAPNAISSDLVDSTGIQLEGNVVSYLLPKTGPIDLPTLQGFLRRYKLILTIENREVPVLVVRQINKQNLLPTNN